MTKRDRDDADDDLDADVDAPRFGYVGNDSRVDRRCKLFAEHARALNAQFMKHCERRLGEDPCAFVISACRDYVRYAKEIREEFQDVLSSEGGIARGKAEAAEEATEAGECFSWGNGDSGQLGLGGDVDEKRRPSVIQGGVMAGVQVVSVACGGTHTLALARGGACYSWGNNDYGVLGRRVDKQANPEAEYEPGKVEIPLGVKIVMIATGDCHATALADDGSVFAWGSFRTANGDWAFNPNTLENKKTLFPFKIYTPKGDKDRVKAIVSGVDHALALTREGGVYSWGCAEKGRLGRFDEREAEENERADDALKRRLLTPGRVSFPASGAGAIGSAFGGEPAMTAIVAGDFHSFAISASEDGSSSTVYGWGLSNCHQIGLWDPNPDLRGDQQVTYFPKRVDALSDKRIVAGDAATHHSLFMTGDGKVIALGRWTDGRCGVRVPNAAVDGALEKPRVVEDLPGRAVKIACGGVNGGAILDDGSAYVWGSQYMGQLGLGPREEDAHLPEKLQYTKSMANKLFADLSFGGQHGACVMVEEAATGHRSKKARS